MISYIEFKGVMFIDEDKIDIKEYFGVFAREHKIHDMEVEKKYTEITSVEKLNLSDEGVKKRMAKRFSVKWKGKKDD